MRQNIHVSMCRPKLEVRFPIPPQGEHISNALDNLSYPILSKNHFSLSLNALIYSFSIATLDDST